MYLRLTDCDGCVIHIFLIVLMGKNSQAIGSFSYVQIEPKCLIKMGDAASSILNQFTPYGPRIRIA